MEGGRRLLRDEGDPRAADGADRRAVGSQHFDSAEADRPSGGARPGGEQPEAGAQEGRLAAPRFPNDRHALAGGDR
jgi:hypothetical protein